MKEPMNTDDEQDYRAMTIIAAAVKLPTSERFRYLQLACQGDAELFHAMTDAVEWEERMGNFLQKPLIALQSVEHRFPAGTVIADRFEIVREVGEGGMGVVYEAFDQKRGQRVAIKSAKLGFRRLLSPELESALKVRHPNICLVNEIHTATTDHGPVDFLTMEFLDGQTLSARLSTGGKVDGKESLEIARQLCAGLAEAHRSRIIHRDLKSTNVVLCRTPEGPYRAVITDFGLAGEPTFESGDLAGTPPYMAPELWLGEKPSQASDIYALGVILYEMVTGSKPFANARSESTLTSRLTASPAPPSTGIKTLDPRWDRTILQCLNPSPAARPAATQALSVFDRRPARQPLVLAIAALMLALAAILWPAIARLFKPADVRLAVLPVQASNDLAEMGNGALQDVSDRINRSRRTRGTLVVIPFSEALRDNVHAPEDAQRVLHATHALQTTIHREGEKLVVQGSLIDLETHLHLRDFSNSYAPEALGTLPGALAGEVSVALRLPRSASREVLSSSATVPYDGGLYFLRRDSQGFDEAILRFEEAARLDSSSPLPLAGLVEAEIKKFHATQEARYLEQAHKYLGSAEGLNPDSVSVRLAAGLLNETTSHYEMALEDYRRVQDLEPGNVDAFLRIAGVFDKLDMPGKAVETYQKAMERDPAYYEPYEDLGEFYYYRGKYAEAAAQFQKTIERAPGMYDAYTNLAAVFNDLGRDVEAEQALLTSLKLRETARALNSMGAMRAFQKRDVDAVTYYSRAVALNPGKYLYLLNLGDSNRRLGRLTDAKTAYRKAMELARAELKVNPRRGYSRAFVAYLAARLGDSKRADEEITQALQLSPGDNEVVRCAVLTYQALGEQERAIEALSGATQELVRQLYNHPDMAEFRHNQRFMQLVGK